MPATLSEAERLWLIIHWAEGIAKRAQVGEFDTDEDWPWLQETAERILELIQGREK